MRQAIGSYGLIALWTICGCIALLVIQQSARQMLQPGQSSDAFADSATPLLDLNSVDVRLRNAGRETVRLHAARFILLRDLQSATIEQISSGVAFESGGRILHFSAGRALFNANMGGIENGHLRLTNCVSATASIGNSPVHITANGVDWQWPDGAIEAEGPVEANVGTLGLLRVQTLQVDPKTRDVSFTGAMASINSTVLPLPSADGQKSSGASEHVLVHCQDGHWDEAHRTLTIEGPATFQEGKALMQTVGAVYDHAAGVATALSPVTIVDDKNTLIGRHGSVNFKTHIATLEGAVEMSATPSQAKSDSSSDTLDSETRKPTQMFCDRVSYNYRTKIADASGHLKIVQTERTVTADTGTYDTNAQLISLVGDVDGRDSDGKHLTAPAATVSVDPKNEYIDVKGPIVYDFPVDDSDNPLPASAQSSSTQSTQPSQSSQPGTVGQSPSPPAAGP